MMMRDFSRCPVDKHQAGVITRVHLLLGDELMR